MTESRTGTGAPAAPGSDATSRLGGLLLGPGRTRWTSRTAVTWLETNELSLHQTQCGSVDGDVKAGLIDLVAYAVDEGWSLRRACGVLEVTHPRVIFWLDRINAGAGLDDRTPGPAQAPHALLDWEREEIIAVYDTWHTIDRTPSTAPTASSPTAAHGKSACTPRNRRSGPC